MRVIKHLSVYCTVTAVELPSHGLRLSFLNLTTLVFSKPTRLPLTLGIILALHASEPLMINSDSVPITTFSAWEW